VLQPKSVEGLLKGLKLGANVVSGYYRRRGDPFTSVWSKKKKKNGAALEYDAKTGMHEIFSSGLGCCLIDMKWLKKNVEPPWFMMGVNLKGEVIWEDAYFFSRVNENGGRVLGNAEVRCAHLGERIKVTDQNWKELRDGCKSGK